MAIVSTLIVAFQLVAALCSFFISQGTKFIQSYTPTIIPWIDPTKEEMSPVGIIAVFNRTGLILLGIEYAVHLGIMGVHFNHVPLHRSIISGDTLPELAGNLDYSAEKKLIFRNGRTLFEDAD